MKIIIAIDSFKGCLTSKEANEAVAEGIRSADEATINLSFTHAK